MLLLVGALIIGALSGEPGLKATESFFVSPFQGILCLFLLEMGVITGRRLEDFRKAGAFLVTFALAAPLLHGILGTYLGTLTGLGVGGATLFGVLAATASYIAVPAAMRIALPEANPAYSLTAALAVTFPFNLTLGLPIYLGFARTFAHD